jgi:carbon-monoxide dehydrogenase medium subunit
MKPAAFEYTAPPTLAEALALKAQYGEEAKFLAGGQSLIPAMNFRLALAQWLVDVNGIGTLDFVRQTPDGGLAIGALTRQRALERHPLIAQHAPLWHEAIPFIAHPQIRNRGTLGGSLAHADPAAELPVLAVASEARFKLQAAHGERWVPASAFFLGLFMTALAPEEMLVEVALPPLPARTGTAFIEFARRRGDYALMGVAAVITLDDHDRCQAARIVYLNAGDGPVVAAQAAQTLLGHTASAELFAAAANAAQAEITPYGNVHATANYQRHLAKVLTQRALAHAFEKAMA